MLQFNYKVIDREGKKTGGRVEAVNAQAASRLLQGRGLVVIKLSVSTGGIFSLLTFLGRQVGLGETATFTRQFSTMVSSGITITEALAILRDQAGRNLSPIIEQVLADVEAGSSLSAALERHPNVFSPVYTALVRAGETGGILDEVLVRLSDNLEKEREFRGKVKGALIYPAIILLGMVTVGAIMILFVIPRLAQIYEEFQAELPLTTTLLISFSSFASRFWWVFLAWAFVLVWAFSLFRRTPLGKRKIGEFVLRIPVIGPLQRQIMLTEFTRTLGLLVGAGVSILESLQVVSKIMGNEVLVEAITRASRDVERGFPLSYSLGQHEQAFPPVVSRMIAVGEETGKMSEVLGKVSQILESESETQVRSLTSAIEPLIMIILGIGVGLLVISIIMPIYNLTSQF